MTFPRDVFLKNLRWVMTASSRGRLRMVMFGMMLVLAHVPTTGKGLFATTSE